MRKLGVRVASAALAACMMASVLPVGAFAADVTDVGTGAGTSMSVPEGAAELPYAISGSQGGNYTISEDRTSGQTVINTTGDVTIYITNDVNSSSTNAVLIVQQVGKLTIVNDGHTVTSDGTFMWVWGAGVSRSDATSQKITVTGGTYKSGAATTFNFNHSGDVSLTNVSAESDKLAVNHNGTGTVTIQGGTYSSTGDAVLLNNSTGGMTIDAEKVSGWNAAVFNKAGTVTIDGGIYTSENSFTVNNSLNSGTLNVNGGTFERTSGDGKTINNNGTMTIGADPAKTTEIEINGVNAAAGAVINEGSLTFNRGTVTAPDGTGIMAVNATTTTINGGTIENCNSGLGMQSGSGKLTVNNVALIGNTHDISLREGQKITFDNGYTGSPSIRVFDPADNRQLTDGAPDGLTITSHNPGYSVKYESGEYYLKRNDLRALEFGEDVTAKADDGSENPNDLNTGDNVAIGTKVILDAKDHTDENKEFDYWEILVDGEDKAAELLENGKNSKDNSFEMPGGAGEESTVTVIAHYKTKTPDIDEPGTDNPDIDDPGSTDSGSDSAGIAGAIVAGGAVIWGAYEAGTGIYRLVHMPGIILPSNRAELALLIWEQADKPAPESEELYADIDEDDTDLQQAARWMAEQELMKDDEDNNKFVPGAPVTKLQVCLTWQKAEDKGLID